MGIKPVVVGQGEDSSPKLWSNVVGVNSEPVVWSRLSICWNVYCKSLLLFSPDLQTNPFYHLLPEHLLFSTGLSLSSCLCLPFLGLPQPSSEGFHLTLVFHSKVK